MRAIEFEVTEAFDYDEPFSVSVRLKVYGLSVMFSALCWALIIRGILWAVEKL